MVSQPVFISYSRTDVVTANKLKNDLTAKGIQVWIDHEQLKPGTRDWGYVIENGIPQCQAIIFIASPAAKKSKYVDHELAIAESYNIPVYPFWIEGEKWINVAPFGWNKTQFIDARTDYPAALAQLVPNIKMKPAEKKSTESLIFPGDIALTPELRRLFIGQQPLSTTVISSDPSSSRNATKTALSATPRRILQTREPDKDSVDKFVDWLYYETDTIINTSGGIFGAIFGGVFGFNSKLINSGFANFIHSTTSMSFVIQLLVAFVGAIIGLCIGLLIAAFVIDPLISNLLSQWIGKIKYGREQRKREEQKK